MAVHGVIKLRFLAAHFFCLLWICAALAADDTPVPRIALAVTNGLIRWWPNLLDAHDEVTGQDGVVRGIVPLAGTAEADEAQFGMHAGWVLLRPALTNHTFTLAFWMRRAPERWVSSPVVLEQSDGTNRWAFRRLDAAIQRYGVVTGDTDSPEREEYLTVPDEGWHHVALACREDSTVLLWLDGERKVNGRVRHTLAPSSPWLNAGNTTKGDEQWDGGLRDLCAFDSVLSDDQVRALHTAGLPNHPAHNTPARLAAAAQIQLSVWSTNVAPVSDQDLIHRRYTTEDGLAGNIVQAVLQAANGYLWVGSEEGFSRFDGRKFDMFNVENTPALRLTGNDVMSLAEAADGTIWAGLYGGLACYRNGEFTAFTNGLPELFVVQAEPAGADSLWVAGFRLDSDNRGPCKLRRFHPERGVTDAVVIVPGQPRRLVTVTNGVWIATEKPEALFFWDGKSSSLVAAAVVANAPASVSIGGAALPPGTQCRGWVNPANAFERWAEIELSPAGPRFQWLWPRTSSRPVAARMNGAGGPDTWLASSPGLALLRQDRLQPTTFANRPTAPDISCAAANHEGGVWFGTEGDGLHFVQERLVRMYTTRDGLEADEVRSVCVGPTGRLWAGGSQWRDGGWESLGPIRASSVADSPAGELWVGLQQTGLRSLQHLNPDQIPPRKLEAFDLPGLPWADPTSLRFAANGTLWVTCARGLTWVKPEGWRGDPSRTGTNSFGRFATGREVPEAILVGIVQDRDGSIWAGTMGKGLIHVRDQQVEVFTKRDGLPGDFCVPVLADKSGALWVTSDGGISRRNNGRFQNIGPADGLPNDVFSDLVEDDFGFFWLPGKRGIHRLERGELEAFFNGERDRVHSVTLGVRDGMLTPECSSEHYPVAAKTPDGRVWVATRNGVAMIDPRRVRLNLQPPPTLIERFVVNRQRIPLPASDRSGLGGQPLRLPAGSGRELAFHYTSISLTAAERVRFRHWLEGYDADWWPATDLRLAFYTNLRPGEYRFRVQAANAHGVWNQEPAILRFVIAPYIWQTAVFWVCLALAITAVIVALHRQRLRAMRRLQALKHEQDLTAEKQRIAADMHDELGATLTQIVMLGEVAKSQAADAAKTRTTLERISQSARDVTARMSELIWVINPRHDTLDNLAAYLREHAARQFEGSPIRTQLDFPAALPECHVSATFRRNVVLVVKEALHNVLKHSGATTLRFRLAVEANELIIRIEDNGRGFDVSARTGAGNGLGNMRQRVTDLGGSLEVQSRPGNGTVIHLRSPIVASGREPEV